MSIFKRKVEIEIDCCLACPHVRLNDPERLDWVCSKGNIPLKRDSIGWYTIPATCPLEKVEYEEDHQQSVPPTGEESLQSGVDPL